jgi:hypothetical protein
MRLLRGSRQVILGQVRAIIWAAMLVPALIWWPQSVAFVIICSVYANAESAWSSAQAADNKEITDRLDRVERRLRALNG